MQFVFCHAQRMCPSLGVPRATKINLGSVVLLRLGQMAHGYRLPAVFFDANIRTRTKVPRKELQTRHTCTEPASFLKRVELFPAFRRRQSSLERLIGLVVGHTHEYAPDPNPATRGRRRSERRC